MPITINGSGSITGVNVGGLPDGIVDEDTLAAGTSFVSYAILAHIEADGTDGGSSVIDTWTTRTINTEVADPDSIVTLSSNQFTLGAGSYLIKWTCSSYLTSSANSRLYDVTNTTSIRNGINAFTSTATNSACNSPGSARVSPTGSTAYEIQMIVNTSNAGDGFGRSNAATGSGEEVYLFVEIYKES